MENKEQKLSIDMDNEALENAMKTFLADRTNGNMAKLMKQAHNMKSQMESGTAYAADYCAESAG